MSTRYLPTHTCATYDRYMGLDKLLMKNEDVLLLLSKLSKEQRTGKDTIISNQDFHYLYSSMMKDVL